MRIMTIIGMSGRMIIGGMRRMMRIRMVARVHGGISGIKRLRGMRAIRIGGLRMVGILMMMKIKNKVMAQTKTKKVMEMMNKMKKNNTKLSKSKPKPTSLSTPTHNKRKNSTLTPQPPSKSTGPKSAPLPTSNNKANVAAAGPTVLLE